MEEPFENLPKPFTAVIVFFCARLGKIFSYVGSPFYLFLETSQCQVLDFVDHKFQKGC